MNDSSPENAERNQTNDGTHAAWTFGMPALLVFLWSTGFVGAKWGLPYAEPFTFVAIRFAIAAAILTVYALAVGAPWPKYGAELRHTIVVGVLMHGVYLTAVFVAIWQGAPAWTASLLTGIHPPLTALLAGPYLKERVTARQWVGFMMGLGGVFLVVWQGGQALVMPMSSLVVLAFGLLALSTGTLYQKRHGGSQDLRTGQAVQQMAAFAVVLPCALLFETGDVQWTGEFILALAWLTGPLSIGMFSLLYRMIRRGAATRIVGLYFLVPPVVAVETFFVFGERMTGQQFLGMALAAAGVALVTWTRR